MQEWGRKRVYHNRNSRRICWHINIVDFLSYMVQSACGVYISSQLIQYSRPCDSYQDFLDGGLLLPMALLNQRFLLIKLKSSLRKFYGHHHDLIHRYGIPVLQITTNLFVSTSRSFLHTWLITGTATRSMRRVSLVELLTYPSRENAFIVRF